MRTNYDSSNVCRGNAGRCSGFRRRDVRVRSCRTKRTLGFDCPGRCAQASLVVEIKGADTPHPEGSFIGAPGGGLDVIKDMTVSPSGEAAGASAVLPGITTRPGRAFITVRVEGNKLVGRVEVQGEPTQEFFGVRAPQFPRVDASKLKAGTPVELFNGKDLKGWHALRANTPFLWKVEDGVLKNGPGTTDLVSDARFMDFRLHVEYKVGAHSNSGIGLARAI